MSRQIKVALHDEDFYKEAALSIVESASKAVEKNGRFTLVLSGGSTPVKLFQLLSDTYFKSRVPWSKTFVFWVDERCVSPDHKDSNYKLAMDNLLSKVPIPTNNIFRMKGEMTPPSAGAKAYESEIKAFFKLTYSVPVFDFMLMGIGEDGHTASLFPGTAALNEKNKLVTSNFVERLNSHRITLTYPVINNAERIFFLVQGESKAPIIKEIFRTDFAQDRYPAQKIISIKGELIWLLNKGAASKLPNEIRDEVKNV
ncbi:MAG: 6-phosphogluconolactonase [Elusimicrobiota bacterium]